MMKVKIADDRLARAKGLLTPAAQGGASGNGAKRRGNGMIDWERVANLRSEVGDDGFIEVIDLFLEETDEVIARLPRHKDAAQIGRDLHFLKGSALNLGFHALAALCQEGERAALAGAPVDLHRLVHLYADSKRSFQAALARHSAA